MQMSTAKGSRSIFFAGGAGSCLPAIADRFPYRDVALPQLELEPGLEDMLYWLRERGVRLKRIHTNRGSAYVGSLARFDLGPCSILS